MRNRKTTVNLTILRFIATIALVLFSFEITSHLFVSEDAQIEIVASDCDDDSELDDQADTFDAILFNPSREFVRPKASPLFDNEAPLKHQHFVLLPTPPPDFS